MKLIFEKQWLHVFALVLLLFGARQAFTLEGMGSGEFCGIGTPQWFWTAIGFAVAHQVFVWFCWRIQLYGRWLDNVFGKLSFPVYASVFFMLGSFRVAAVFALAISNRDTLLMDIAVLRMLAVVLLLPAIYLLYSVIRYFGFTRALGADHFEEKYRMLPLVRRGIFRFTDNGMYAYGFLFLWAIALWYASTAALCVALFNHLYIWVHYYATELPDMKRIYGMAPLRKEN